MEEKIREVLQELVSAEAARARVDEDLRELGLDSVAFIKMIVALEEISGREIGDEYLLLDAMNTIQKIQGALA